MAVKRMDIKEFREKGYLQEANRLFFHPLGLALEVILDEESDEARLGGIWDDRYIADGRVFDTFDRQKAKAVASEREARREARAKLECCDENGIQERDFDG